MKVANWFQLSAAVCALPLALAGCGGGSLPDNDAASVKEWIASGEYKNWTCQEAAHEKTPPSPHGVNRICSNAVLSGTAAGAAFPKDSSAVKEIYDKVGGSIIGYAYYRKTQDDSAAGMGWYYYETSPPAMMPVAAQGAMGCVACHSAAGADEAHLKANGAHDFVYVQVK